MFILWSFCVLECYTDDISCICTLVSNNMETVKKLKHIFDDFRLAARMYAKVSLSLHVHIFISFY